MNLKVILLLLVAVTASSGECTSDCANGWKIITDVFYCRQIFGDPSCNGDTACLTDYNNYKACSLTGCFGDMSNLSNINQYNQCVEKCTTTTAIIKTHALGFYNCMNVAFSTQLTFYSLLSAFLLTLLF